MLLPAPLGPTSPTFSASTEVKARLEEEDLAPVPLGEGIDAEHGEGGVTKGGRIGI